ncbi:hypothetical protein [Phenylobacterium sp. SCN 70-31]|mgnify:CR=1 FL=1|uniref:hypothetical protein n=1 Tax=Phenylobacterium sp. SCN 70-31 TaxID=1660129 RepID=UPI00086D055B|nr:hypothetical protein [Phenylobacterium sp. SCN 70-31]ODT85135.1 MAG: hypothetical protein ABS78_21370 [Phenylobacterium sp. SCN 70-31]
MIWSMPRPVLQLVACLLGLASVGAFAMGIVTAQPPGRLPGEAAGGVDAEILQAQDATPLVDERIEGRPEPEELTPEEKAALDAEKKAKAEAEALAKAEAAKGAPAGPESVVTPIAPPPPVAKAEPVAPPQPKLEEPVF